MTLEPALVNLWQDSGKSEGIWDSEEAFQPQAIIEHLHWDPNAVVDYFSAHQNVIETT